MLKYKKILIQLKLNENYSKRHIINAVFFKNIHLNHTF